MTTVENIATKYRTINYYDSRSTDRERERKIRTRVTTPGAKDKWNSAETFLTFLD